MIQISTIIVAGLDADGLKSTVQSVSEISSEIKIFDTGIPQEVKDSLSEEFQTIEFVPLQKPSYVELVRQLTIDHASHEWVLVLDPDEYLSPDLVKYIKEAGVQDAITHYKIPRQNYIFKKWISHSRWWPDYQVRLFRKDSISWPRELHAQPVLKGRGVVIPAFTKERQELSAIAIVHQNYTDVLSYIEKAIRYARVDAESRIQNGESFTILTASKLATGEFISRFFADSGYKDGIHGFILALLQMFYYYLVFIFAWEKGGYEDASSTTVLKAQRQLFVGTARETYFWLSREGLVKGFEKTLNRIRSKFVN